MAEAPPLRILIAEDNPVNQKVAVRMLERFGSRVEVAGNGAEAVRFLEETNFDLIFMDCQMPEVDGFQATGRIRALPGPRARVPVIAMTAFARKEDRDRCLEAGMDDYISKPIRMEELRRILGQWGHVRSASEGAAPFDRAAALENAAGEEEILAEAVAAFRSEAGPTTAELDRCLAARDVPGIGKTAHRLKGSLLTLAAGPAAEAARRLETMARAGNEGGLAAAAADLEREMERFLAALEGAFPVPPPR